MKPIKKGKGGLKPRFNEPMKVLYRRVPASKLFYLQNMVDEKLEEFAKKQKT